MTMAMKWAGSATGTDNVGAVRYEYCLSCDGALSKRFEYGPGTDLPLEEADRGVKRWVLYDI